MQKFAISELSKTYIQKAGDTYKDKYQKRTLFIVGFSYSMIGALMMILPFLLGDPIFLCVDPKNPGG